ncbi:MAG: hypothetical protein AAGJ46_06385 [Planctomycetota bacterium]
MNLRPHFVVAMVGLIACGGCQSLGVGKGRLASKAGLDKVDIPDGVPWKKDKDREPETPGRVVATWKDAVLQRQGKPAERGFGGRLFFYNNEEVEPIEVEGQLVVYAFDETDRDPTNAAPTKKFVFPPEQFIRHKSESDLGVSYSVWLPWGQAGGPSSKISLMARFEPLTGGSLIVSEMSNCYLPGATPMLPETRVARQSLTPVIQQASHAAETPATSTTASSAALPSGEPRQRMQTTSIKLPPRASLRR